MKYIIVGASGLIGSALYDKLITLNKNVIGTFSHNFQPGLIYFDLNQEDHKTLIDQIDPDDVVYLLSAYSNPSWIYSNKILAEQLNWNSTCKFIDQLKHKLPRLIFMSSVEVFDGTTGNYAEFDKPNPLNLYGHMKLNVERYLKENYSNYTIVRTGWNVGLNVNSRCVVNLTYDSLLKANAKMASDNSFSISAVKDTANGLYLLSYFPNIKEMHLCSDTGITRTMLASLICQNSKNKDKMKFSECKFSEIIYSEPRGRVNNLNNTLSKKVLGIEYQSYENIILNKIRFIDKNA